MRPCDRLAAQAAYRFNRLGLRCGAALLDAYQRLKEARQTLDFTDVEWRVHQLLNRSDHAEYMQYKLDAATAISCSTSFRTPTRCNGRSCAPGWMPTAATRQRARRVFLVGDPKQSIYRFRRAEPRLFSIAADSLERDFAAARLEQDSSRRSAPAVIQAVNRVFAAQPDFAGFREHGWHHEAQEGAIALLPLAEKSARPLPSPLPEPPAKSPEDKGEGVNALVLRNPLQQPRQEDEDVRHEQEAVQLAEKIAAIVGHWQVDDEKHGPRPAAYRDIMLLVRSRTWLATYERALRAARIPYLSSRQGGLLDTLECSDLAALAGISRDALRRPQAGSGAALALVRLRRYRPDAAGARGGE